METCSKRLPTVPKTGQVAHFFPDPPVLSVYLMFASANPCSIPRQQLAFHIDCRNRS